MSGPKPSEKNPEAAAGDVDLGYDPQGSGQEHDAFFREVAPGVANSGNLSHKWGPEGDHWQPDEPPSGEKSE